MQRFNYHTHTYRCKHSDQTLSDEEYVQLFIKKGFKKICFTDHCPHEEQIDCRNNMRMEYSQKDEYYNSINSLKEKYKNAIEIEKGFEVEYVSGLESYLNQLKNETDKLILGQHFVFDKNGNIKYIGWEPTDGDDLLNYAKCIESAMQHNIPNIIAHPDLFMLDKSCFGEIEEEATNIICKAAEKYQIPLEINLTRACMNLFGLTNKIEYPDRNFWKIASTYNIKVVYGVDAHFRDQIQNFEKSIELVNKHLGMETIKKLNFVNEKL